MRCVRYLPVGLCMVIGLASCGSDTTSPRGDSLSDGGTVNGSWVVALAGVAGDGATCEFPSLVVTLHQSSSGSISGSFASYGRGACILDGKIFSGALGSGGIVGVVLGDTASIALSGIGMHWTGFLRSAGLFGQASWEVDFVGSTIGVIPLTGTWEGASLPSSALPGTPADVLLTPDLPAMVREDSVHVTAQVVNAAGDLVPGAAVALAVADTTSAAVSATKWVVGRGRAGPFVIRATTGPLVTQSVGVILPSPRAIQIAPIPAGINRTHTLQLQYAVLDSIGDTVTYVTPTLISRNPSVATVTQGGLVSSVGPLGSAEIVASAGVVRDSVRVNVVAVAVNPTVTPASAMMARHDSLRLLVSAIDSANLPLAQSSITFSSTDSAVATVSEEGEVVAVGSSGHAVIRIQAPGVDLVSRILVRTAPPPAIVATTHLGGSPYGLAIGPTGAFYVTDGTNGGYFRGDLPATGVSAEYSVAGPMRAVAFDPTGARAFIAGLASGYVGVVDVTDNEIVDSIAVPFGVGKPEGIAVSPDGSTLLVGCDNALELYDAHSFALLHSVAGSLVNHFAFHPTLNRVYATSSADQVREIDLSTGATLRSWTGGAVEGVAVAPDGSALYIAGESLGLQVIDLGTGEETGILPDVSAFGIAISPSQDLIYVGATQDQVFVIDRTSLVTIATLSVGGLPRRIAVDPTGTTVMVANESGWVDFIQ